MFDYSIQRLNEEEFAKFAKLIYEESGIFLKDTKITLLSNRLRKRLQSLNIDTYSGYFDYILALPDKSAEIDNLLDVVSTNETYFFRNERHFDALLMNCFPDIAAKKREKKITIWSAGCSTGEEPYTLAICLLEAQKYFKDWKCEILATDISHTVLKFAEEGKYSGRRIEKVQPLILDKYFTQDKTDPTQYVITPEVRSLVKFGHLNLFKDIFPSNIDIIFCRNVMIYFDREHQRKLVKNFYNSLSKEYGYFFIGHSETLHTISEDFLYVKLMDSPVYVPGDRANEFSTR